MYLSYINTYHVSNLYTSCIETPSTHLAPAIYRPEPWQCWHSPGVWPLAPPAVEESLGTRGGHNRWGISMGFYREFYENFYGISMEFL